MPDDSCTGWDAVNPFCYVEQEIKATVGDAIENMATAVVQGYGKTIASLGTVWVNIGTPDLTGSGGSSAIAAGSSAPDSSGITTALGYVMWISLAVAVLSLFFLGALVASRMRAGEGVMGVGRMGLVLGAVVLISGASALISGLMPSGPSNVGGAALFLQSSLWWYMGAAAIVSVIIGGARMAWEQRADPGRETVKSLLTLVVVAGAGVTVIGLLVTAADSFAVWLINGSLSCDVTGDGGSCFSENMLKLLVLSETGKTGSLGPLLTIILGLIAIIASAIQIVLMVARGGMLVILAGILPLSASFTNTEMGKSWFRRCVGWLTAFILYKPAAAIVYAAAFQLVGTDVFTDDGTGLMAVLTGLMLMVIALFAMPALMRFITPMVSGLAGGAAAGAVAGGALAALPSGAAQLGRLISGSPGANGLGGENGRSPSSSAGQQPSGGDQGGGGSVQQPAQLAGAQQGGGQLGGGQGGGAGSTSGGGAAQGMGAQQGGGAGAAAGGGAMQGAGGAGASASGGGAMAAGGGAAAAAGPAGLAAAGATEALDAASRAGQAAVSATQGFSEQAIGEGSGPDGSR